MFQRLQARNAEEEGFTLIELMVVVLIIGILIAIALPTFLGARQRAQDKAAQSSLRNALVAAKTAFTDTDNFCGAVFAPAGTCSSSAGLSAIEPSLTFSAATSNGPKVVAATISGGVAGAEQEWHAAALSDTGTCWYIKDVASPAGSAGTFYGSDTTAPTCTGAAADTNATLAKF